MPDTALIWSLADRHADSFTALADRVWSTPEVNFEERASAAAMPKRCARRALP